MKTTIWTIIGLLLAALVFGASVASAAGPTPHRIGPKDKCPVCGMFVAKYPDFAAQIQFRDGATFHFDGAKDMFKFYLNPSGYVPDKRPADIAAVFVTDYYDLNMINGRTAYYVLGSDVYGPMGRELVPFAQESKARDFLKDHHGKAIVRFQDVTATLLRQLE